jgi:hypothetical protein
MALRVEDLSNAFQSKRYINELKELSPYGDHIKQERPMV